jgi:hypothetical protein
MMRAMGQGEWRMENREWRSEGGFDDVEIGQGRGEMLFGFLVVLLLTRGSIELAALCDLWV